MLKVNNILIKPTIFSDNTSQVWKLPSELLAKKSVRIDWDFNNEGEYMHLAQLKMLLNNYSINATLHMSYLPYARQDKDVSNESTFAFKVFAGLINKLDFVKVYALDPHSNAGHDYIINFVSVFPDEAINKTIITVDPDLICYPDKGAVTRYSETVDYPYVYADKVRNQLTGAIEGITLNGDVKDKSVLILDDLCDAGGTFIGLTKELLAAGARKVNLYVTHGIFSKGLTPLTECGISRVFTKDGEIGTLQGQIVYKEL